MNTYYLLFIGSKIIQRYILRPLPRFNLHLEYIAPYLQAQHLQEGASICFVSLGDHSQVLPFVYRVLAINSSSGAVTFQLESIQNRSVRLADVAAVKAAAGNLYTEYEGLKLDKDQFTHIVAQMGGPRMEEKMLLDAIQRYITARGYYFDQETLYNYHICLKTRPFVILAGLSGTGKSKLTQLYAEALGHREHFLRVPVRPNWSDDRYLLGYFNTITGEYIAEPAVEFLVDANNDEANLYFFCLDEMNLAHVEYYFAQFLSAMEEERPEERRIILLSKHMQEQMLLRADFSDLYDRLVWMQERLDTTHYDLLSQKLQRHMAMAQRQAAMAKKFAQIVLPPNLFVTGTINVDETTQPISDKVMDRANTLEFFRVDLEKIPQPTELPEPVHLSTYTWHSYQVTQPDRSFRSQIVEISNILHTADLGLGYRVLHEIELYIANSAGLLAPRDAFDLQVKQRILPRVRGSEVISEMVDTLLAYLKAQDLMRSEQRLTEMKKRLKRDGYTSFWR
ncbi:MAG TPA: hypothetical protein VGF67_29150 [Ktedonobacteraceae bacterium]|jgi:energy-coupling factor transporter ATP-binding protein EcfA2